MAYCDEVQAISVVVVCIVNDAEFVSDVVVCIQIQTGLIMAWNQWTLGTVMKRNISCRDVICSSIYRR